MSKGEWPTLQPNGLLSGPLFPKWDRHIKVARIVGCAGAAAFVILFADFGEKEHCFTPIRKMMVSTINSFGGLTADDEQAIAEQLQTSEKTEK